MAEPSPGPSVVDVISAAPIGATMGWLRLLGCEVAGVWIWDGPY